MIIIKRFFIILVLFGIGAIAITLFIPLIGLIFKIFVLLLIFEIIKLILKKW
jgi:hypothetical protein